MFTNNQRQKEVQDCNISRNWLRNFRMHRVKVKSLYYLCNATTEDEILKPDVVDAIKRAAAPGNLAQSLLDKHASKLN